MMPLAWPSWWHALACVLPGEANPPSPSWEMAGLRFTPLVWSVGLSSSKLGVLLYKELPDLSHSIPTQHCIFQIGPVKSTKFSGVGELGGHNFRGAKCTKSSGLGGYKSRGPEIHQVLRTWRTWKDSSPQGCVAMRERMMQGGDRPRCIALCSCTGESAQQRSCQPRLTKPNIAKK